VFGSPARRDTISWRSRFKLLAIVGCGVLASIGGCDKTRQQPRTLAQLVDDTVAYHGHADAINAQLGIKVVPKHGKALNFTLSVRSPADGRIRVRAYKAGFDFCDALIQPNGDFTAYLSMTKETFSGNLRSFLPEGATGNLALLVNDLKSGPLPLGPEIRAGDAGTLRTVDPATGFDCVLAPSARGLEFTSKLMIHELAAFREEFVQYGDVDGLHRPTGIKVTSSLDPDVVTTISVGIDVVPTISDTGMSFKVPDKAIKISIEDFTHRIP
jgi:hypothetical protein